MISIVSQGSNLRIPDRDIATLKRHRQIIPQQTNKINKRARVIASSNEDVHHGDVYGIPDIHSTTAAWDASLYEAGLIDIDGNATEHAQESNTVVIQIGDIVGKGKQFFATLDRILSLREQGTHIEVLSGNHEVHMHDALLTESQSVRRNWLMLPTGQKMIVELNQRYEKVGKPIDKLRSLLYEGEYAPIFSTENTKAADYTNNTLYFHAGLGDYWMEILKDEGIEGLNAAFRALLTRESIHELLRNSKNQGSKSDICWQHKDAFLDFCEHQQDNLLEMGITNIVRGHDPHRTIDVIRLKNGLTITNLDVDISNTSKRMRDFYSDGKYAFSCHNKKDGLFARSHCLDEPKISA